MSKPPCRSRFDVERKTLVFCDLPAEPKHIEHVNAEHDARWHDDYAPKATRGTP